ESKPGVASSRRPAQDRVCAPRQASKDAALLQQPLLIAGHPTKYLRVTIQNLNEIVDIEINRRLGEIVPGICCRPGNMCNAMKIINPRQSKSANPHLLGADFPVMIIATDH